MSDDGWGSNDDDNGWEGNETSPAPPPGSAGNRVCV